MDFVNENYPGASEAKQGVHYVCIAGKFARGQAEYGGLWKVIFIILVAIGLEVSYAFYSFKMLIWPSVCVILQDFTWQSYELCCGEGDVWGDGVIPVKCATGLEGAEHVILEGIHENINTSYK